MAPPSNKPFIRMYRLSLIIQKVQGTDVLPPVLVIDRKEWTHPLLDSIIPGWLASSSSVRVCVWGSIAKWLGRPPGNRKVPGSIPRWVTLVLLLFP